MDTPRLKPALASALPPIHCVVVLMLENRSFDHVFGNWPGVAGLSEGPFANRPNPAAAAAPSTNKAIAEGQPALFTVAQGQGPGHSVDATNVQLFTTKVVAAAAAVKAPDNRGFVQSYQSELAADGFAGAGVDLTPVMQTFSGAQLPGSGRARAKFRAVRSVVCGGTRTDDAEPARTSMRPHPPAGRATTGACRSTQSRSTSSCRPTAAPGPCTTATRTRSRSTPASTRSAPISSSTSRASPRTPQRASSRTTTSSFRASPAPPTDGPVTSMHAPQDVRPGDQLVADVYAALRASPQWPQTLLVVTFDEHGGYFDHAILPPRLIPMASIRLLRATPPRSPRLLRSIAWVFAFRPFSPHPICPRERCVRRRCNILRCWRRCASSSGSSHR